jgi:membrane protein
MAGRYKTVIDAGVLAFGVATLLATRRGPAPAPAPATAQRVLDPARRDNATSLQAAKPGQGRPGAAAGQMADKPSQIPARGWWAIAKRVYADVNQKRLMTEAAGITFYALLSVFPALATLVSLYGLFADPTTIAKSLDAVSVVVPGGGMDIITQQVQHIASNGHGTLSFGIVIGLATSLWSSNQGIKAIVDSLNLVYDEKETRSFFRRTLLTLGFTAGALVFILIALSGVVVLPILLNFLGLSGVTDILLRLARWPVLLLAVIGFIAVLYRYGPNRQPARWRWVTWGSAFAAILWVVVSVLFSWYVSNFGSYNKTYGSLGAAVGFMTWIWLSATVVLTGAQLDAEMEYQTTQDTTAGAPRPMGARGAAKADSVAA